MKCSLVFGALALCAFSGAGAFTVNIQDCSRWFFHKCEPKEICARGEDGKVEKFKTECDYEIKKCYSFSEWTEVSCSAPQEQPRTHQPKQHWFQHSTYQQPAQHHYQAPVSHYQQPAYQPQQPAYQPPQYNYQPQPQPQQYYYQPQPQPQQYNYQPHPQPHQQNTPDCSRYETMKCAESFICARNSRGQYQSFTDGCSFGQKKCMEPENAWTKVDDSLCPQAPNNSRQSQPRQEPAKRDCSEYDRMTCTQSTVCAQNNKGEAREFGNSCSLSKTQCLEPENGWTRASSSAVCRGQGHGQHPSQQPAPQTSPDCSRYDMMRCATSFICARNNRGQYQSFTDGCTFGRKQCMEPESAWTKVDDSFCQQAPNNSRQSQPRQEPAKRDCSEYDRMSCAMSTVCAQNNKGEAREFGDSCMLGKTQCLEPENGWTRASSSAVCRGQGHGQHPSQQPAPQSSPDCSRYDMMRCATSYICARNNRGQYQSFTDGCTFGRKQCMEPENAWTKVEDSFCKAAKPDCSKVDQQSCIQSEVCGVNNRGEARVFGSPCSLDKVICIEPENDWEPANDTACSQQGRAYYQQAPRKNDCSQYDRMVCGQAMVCARNAQGEWKQFGSSCTLSKTQCLEPEKRWQEIAC